MRCFPGHRLLLPRCRPVTRLVLPQPVHCMAKQRACMQTHQEVHTGEGNGNSNGYHHHGSNGNGNGNGKGPHVFRGSCSTALQEWLEKHGVDTSRYGHGYAKHVEDLFEEQERLESVLSVSQEGQALREVRVLSLHIVDDKGQVLFEDEQILPDGRSRKRQVAVSEKLVGNECWRQAVDRAVLEELSGALPPSYQIQVLDDTYRRLEEISASMSYPGLLTKYIFHRVSARLHPGLPEGPFETREPRPGGELITRWRWRDVSSLSDTDCATKSTG